MSSRNQSAISGNVIPKSLSAASLDFKSTMSLLARFATLSQSSSVLLWRRQPEHYLL